MRDQSSYDPVRHVNCGHMTALVSAALASTTILTILTVATDSDATVVTNQGIHCDHTGDIPLKFAGVISTCLIWGADLISQMSKMLIYCQKLLMFT